MNRRSGSDRQVNQRVVGAGEGVQTWLGISAPCVGLFRHQRALCVYSHLSWFLGTGKKCQKCVSVTVLMLILID